MKPSMREVWDARIGQDSSTDRVWVAIARVVVVLGVLAGLVPVVVWGLTIGR